VACWTIVIDGRKRGPQAGMPIVLISHHALSRAAQRWGARTVEDMLGVGVGFYPRTIESILLNR
jgi:hypothetical protein